MGFGNARHGARAPRSTSAKMIALGRGCCAGVASPAAFCHDLQRREPQNPEEDGGRAYEFPYPPRISSRAVTTSFLRVAAPRRVKSLERLARALGVPVMEQLE